MMNLDQAKAQLTHQYEYGQAHELDDAIGVVLTQLNAWEAINRSARVGAEYAERVLQAISDGLRPLCPCDPNPETTDGPQRECPLHGDGETFVAEVRRLREMEQRALAVRHGRVRSFPKSDGPPDLAADVARYIRGETG